MNFIEVVVDIPPFAALLKEYGEMCVSPFLPIKKNNEISMQTRLKIYYGVETEPCGRTKKKSPYNQDKSQNATISSLPLRLPVEDCKALKFTFNINECNLPILYRVCFQLMSSNVAPLEWYSRNLFVATPLSNADSTLLLHMNRSLYTDKEHTSKFKFYQDFDNLQVRAQNLKLDIATQDELNHVMSTAAPLFRNINNMSVHLFRKELLCKV